MGKKQQGLIGFMTRLRQDARGNTLAMMAAMMIPLGAFAGSAIDMGRLYAVKSRLQQACDAGALAGRKAMLISKSGTFTSDAQNTAKAFFNNNFQTGWYNTSSATFAAKMVAGSTTDVQGDATTVVPMTIMKMLFEVPSTTVSVSCTARYEVSDSDVMFVLDTTGSMNDPAPSGGSTKIEGVKSAVLTFYDTMDAAKAAQPDTNIRYGFVTYASSVNVGRVLYAANPAWLALKWQYHTRTLLGDQNLQDSSNKDVPPVVTTQTLSQSDCTAKAGRTPTTGYYSNATAKMVSVTWAANVCTLSTQTVIPKWKYQQIKSYDFPTALLPYGSTILDPSKAPPGPATGWSGFMAKWEGCIEERHTDVGALSYTLLPPDLDPDLAPSADVDSSGMPTDKDTRWKPLWSDITYWRGSSGAEVIDTTPTNSSPYGNNSSYANLLTSNGRGTCGQEAKRLNVMARADVQNYVSTLTAQGNTYHDLGMIWGTRLISPTGIFAGDTAPWPGRPAPNRYIIFMTDGEMAPNYTSYTSYGIEAYDQRVTGGSFGQDTNYHNARFLAECAAAKARNITVFTVGFGTALTSQLKTCASLPSYAVQASSNAELKAAFQQIAQKVAQLRLQK